MAGGKNRYWNIWWTLAVLSALLGFVALVLEYLGILHDLGTLIGFFSTALTVLFGLTASTRRSTKAIEQAVHDLHDDIDGLRGDVQPMARALQRIEAILDERLPRGQNT